MRRNFLSPFLQDFDLPTPFATIGARSVSNVPAQALALANDPFVHAECGRWATNVLAAAGSENERLITVWQRAFARPPSDEEMALASAFLAASTASGLSGAEAFADLLHALVNTTEFLYLR